MTNDASNEVLVTYDGAVATVTLNRPHVYNAVNAALHAALLAALDRVHHHTEARAVVLTGAGKAFSAGGDLAWLEQTATDPGERRRALTEARVLVETMLRFPLPVVAAVNGPAVGLGCSLAGLSDIIYMADTAYLADPHVAVGLVAGDGGVLTWPFFMGLSRAKEYLFTGDRIAAADAERWGLANAVFPADDLLGRAREMAERLAMLPVQALQDTKRAINLHVLSAAPGILDFALAAESESFASNDHRDLVRALRIREGDASRAPGERTPGA